MTTPFNPELDLSISRIIKAPRADVWNAWTTASSFEQWWIPAPARCRVVTMDVRPGGALVTEMSEGGAEFTPHIQACYLAVDPMERLVFTNCLVGDWRPADTPFMTAIITLKDHALGTDYAAHVMHKNAEERARHDALGFHEGWGAVADQLAALVEGR